MVRIAVSQRSVLHKGLVPWSMTDTGSTTSLTLPECQGPSEHEMLPDMQKLEHGLHRDMMFDSVQRSGLLRGFQLPEKSV